ncbi:hypothetical protein GLAREA_05188 [Glarea lozoyensis ATCC 20868]|uniref:Uncharacterized protein n=1 Tax=Glarea lozoyensis (strain ATCC 20868 / MF5171) TaxID=1116229 RepID=S3DDP8_GLAL2|nr:uncharacterized protein GLAREA_05188 [Glarea lozoyensis ATCC 20868]EPE35850.1 hypothetical protein GLAREA_05188 [Glarea lozoyensis ATCC 20868]
MVGACNNKGAGAITLILCTAGHYWSSHPSLHTRAPHHGSLGASNVIETLSEMFVGIICACMPAAAYSARQKDSIWQKLLKATSHIFTLIGSTLQGSKCAMNQTSRSQVTENFPEPDPLKSTDRKYAQYFNLEDIANNTTAKTAISGSFTSFDNETKVIQRQFDVDIERN